jgi:hypothetical protein
MKSIFLRIRTLDFTTLLWAVPIVNMLHELEEWNVIPWEQATFVGLMPISNLAIRLLLLANSLFAFFFVWLATRFRNARITAYIVVPAIALIILNGGQHILWSISFLSYSPGLIFGGIIGVPLYLYLVIRATTERLVHPVYTGVFAIIVAYGLIQTIMLGHTMSPLITVLYGIARALERLMTS